MPSLVLIARLNVFKMCNSGGEIVYRLQVNVKRRRAARQSNRTQQVRATFPRCDHVLSRVCSPLTQRCCFLRQRSSGNMTGMVGTALYVSPEVQGTTKANYNQVGF